MKIVENFPTEILDRDGWEAEQVELDPQTWRVGKTLVFMASHDVEAVLDQLRVEKEKCDPNAPHSSTALTLLSVALVAHCTPCAAVCGAGTSLVAYPA